MKQSELKKLRGKNDQELLKDLQNSRDTLWQLSADLAAGKVKNVREVRKLKSKIAVINTILHEIKLAK